MTAADRQLTTLLRSSRSCHPVAAKRTNMRPLVGAEEKSAREPFRSRFVLGLLKALSALSV